MQTDLELVNYEFMNRNEWATKMRYICESKEHLQMEKKHTQNRIQCVFFILFFRRPLKCNECSANGKVDVNQHFSFNQCAHITQHIRIHTAVAFYNF